MGRASYCRTFGPAPSARGLNPRLLSRIEREIGPVDVCAAEEAMVFSAPFRDPESGDVRVRIVHPGEYYATA